MAFDHELQRVALKRHASFGLAAIAPAVLIASIALAEPPPPGSLICAPYDSMPIRDAAASLEQYAVAFASVPHCAHPLKSSKDDDALRTQSLSSLRRLNITAVTSGSAAYVKRWYDADPKRVIPALSFGMDDAPSPESLRALHAAGLLQVLGEITIQYQGVAPDDPKFEPYWALAEELNIPAGIHIGPGPPGADTCVDWWKRVTKSGSCLGPIKWCGPVRLKRPCREFNPRSS